MTLDAELRWKEHNKKKSRWAQHHVQQNILIART
jgi:hypothetical protein